MSPESGDVQPAPEAPGSSLIPDGTMLSAPVGTPSPLTAADALPQATVATKKRRKMKLKLPAVSAMTWNQIWAATVEFFRDPVNLALFVWMVLTIPACVIIVMIKLGLMDKIIPNPETREKWDEVSVQVVNALFALTCLIMLPLLTRHTVLLIRWRQEDRVELRQFFCKNGKRKPHDRTHMAIVVLFGQITCWATLAFSAIYWLYPLGERPVWLVSISFVASMVAPVISFLYLLLSPLSKDYDIVKEGDDEQLKMYQRKHGFFLAHREVKDAQWNGTVCPGCCADTRVAWCTFFLPCCMFGYNMERLGFGHRVVHTIAFIVVLFGPVLVFQFSAQSLKDLGLTEKIIYYSGVALAFCGVAYGGAWRIRMRETYGLPGSRWCCGSKRMTDVCTWVWCSYCALCQEVRTTDQYQVEESSYYQHADVEGGTSSLPATLVAAEGDTDLDADEDADEHDHQAITVAPAPLAAMHAP